MVLGRVLAEIFETGQCGIARLNFVENDQCLIGQNLAAPHGRQQFDNPRNIEIGGKYFTQGRLLLTVEVGTVGVRLLTKGLQRKSLSDLPRPLEDQGFSF
jgi:hypothetical protein